MAKVKTLRLSFPHAPDDTERNRILYDPAMRTEERGALFEAARRYRVEAVGDSIEPRPGDYLTREQADALCADDAWKVTLVPVKD